MYKYISKYVACPYYRKNEQNRIVCEGVDPTNTISLVFECKEKLLEYQRNYCNDILAHRDCRLCMMLTEKWEEEKNEQIRK